jgi:hypothetical protein
VDDSEDGRRCANREAEGERHRQGETRPAAILSKRHAHIAQSRPPARIVATAATPFRDTNPAISASRGPVLAKPFTRAA